MSDRYDQDCFMTVTASEDIRLNFVLSIIGGNVTRYAELTLTYSGMHLMY
jgi:hypothetical protein